MKYVLVVLILALIAVPAGLYFLSTGTALTVAPPVKVVGFTTPVHIHAVNKHGIRSLTVTVEQDGKTNVSTVASAPATHIFPARNVAPKDLSVNVGRQSDAALHDGKAKVIVTAVSNDLRAQTTTQSFDVDVMTTAPRVVADGVQHYINQGGSEMVTFTPSGAWTEAGVMVGDRKFRSYPLPNHPGQYFSLFAFSYNLPVDTPIYVYASNPSGAIAKATFWYKVFPKKFRASPIALESMHIDRIVNQIDPQHKYPGKDDVERFVWINSQLRKVNNKTLADLRLDTEQKFLWTGAFLPMVDSTVESRFADDRTYTWQGKKVDEQTHLGFDLAKVQHSPVPASNDGRVIWAEDLGIYGNCIVIDHGFGLDSLYGHLSEFLVKKGDLVKKGQIIAKTGSTGLAGGDHLHFTMTLDGVQINPVEWWDPHWVHDRILSKMGDAEPASDAAPVSEAPKRAISHKKKKGRH